MPQAHDEEYGFAYLPDDKPARLIRQAVLPEDDMISVLDRDRNILFISAPNIGKLPEQKESSVLRTHAAVTRLRSEPDGSFGFYAD